MQLGGQWLGGQWVGAALVTAATAATVWLGGAAHGLVSATSKLLSAATVVPPPPPRPHRVALRYRVSCLGGVAFEVCTDNDPRYTVYVVNREVPPDDAATPDAALVRVHYIDVDVSALLVAGPPRRYRQIISCLAPAPGAVAEYERRRAAHVLSDTCDDWRKTQFEEAFLWTGKWVTLVAPLSLTAGGEHRFALDVDWVATAGVGTS